MKHYEQYKLWLESDFTIESMKDELRAIEDNPKEIEDRFYKDLEFGTAGLRGIIGVGTNRMNELTIARATQGLADYLIDEYKNNISVAIAYDSRHMSKEFAWTAACVLADNNIKVYLYDDLRSTPQLSFTVRQLKCNAGIVITASHNPSNYNGYKVYNKFGGQIIEDEASKITEKISNVNFNDIKLSSQNESNNNIIIIGEDLDKIYIDMVKKQKLSKDLDLDINIIYTPLHGTGNIPVRRVLRETGFNNVYVVAEQELPDGDFPTVEKPNPEDVEAFALAVRDAVKVNADIILGTDPDCDRVGVMVKDTTTGLYQAITGNQIGALLVNYILNIKKAENSLPKNSIIVNTIVTDDLGEKIAQAFGVKTEKTLTGFKYIANKIQEYDNNKQYSFIFGYEESYGFLAGDFVRDKDAVISSMLIAEMSAYYKKRGKTLLDILQDLYKTYGFYEDEVISINVEGASGQNKITRIIENFRDNKPTDMAGYNIKESYDYKLSMHFDLNTGDFEKITLPKSNVLKFCFEDGSWFVIRPSGTEPKMKIYLSLCGQSYEEAIEKLNRIKDEIMSIINCIV